MHRPNDKLNFAVFALLLVCSVATNVFLARKVASLKAYIVDMKSEGRLQIGSNVPPLEAHTLEGTARFVDFRSSRLPTMLYVFTPQCVWCKKNLDNLRVLIDKSGSQYQIVGVSLTRQDLKEYLERERLEFPVYTDLSDQTKNVYHLGLTPETIIVSTEAKVLRVWGGAYTSDLRQELESYLGFQLPGCCTEPASGAEAAVHQ